MARYQLHLVSTLPHLVIGLEPLHLTVHHIGVVVVREEPGIIPGENSPSKRWLTATLPQGIVHHQPLLSGQRLLLGIKCPDEVGPVAVGSGGDVVWLEEVDGQLLIILNVLTV